MSAAGPPSEGADTEQIAAARRREAWRPPLLSMQFGQRRCNQRMPATA
jgi:hypothetical protein